MARLHTSGFETRSGYNSSSDTTNPDGHGTGIFGTIDTTNQRSGSACFLSNASGEVVAFPMTFVSGTTYFVRIYIKKSADPTVTGVIIGTSGNNGWNVKFHTDGTLGLYYNTNQIGSSSFALSNNIYYRVEMSAMMNTTASAVDSGSLYIDGGLVTSDTSDLGTSLSSVAYYLGRSGGMTGTYDLFIDDVAINDSNGSDQNSFPDDGKIVLLVPNADGGNSGGHWTAGAGGTTSLFEAVNNAPPIGTASETNLTQIENATAGGGGFGSTNAYRPTTPTYASAGIVGTIVLINALCCHGEDVSTGTKTGSASLYSNPSGSGTNFNYGNDVGALGTYPTNWSWAVPVYTYNPVIDINTALTLAIAKTDSGTRVASVCFLGSYVEYRPPKPLPPFVMAPYRAA